MAEVKLLPEADEEAKSADRNTDGTFFRGGMDRRAREKIWPFIPTNIYPSEPDRIKCIRDLYKCVSKGQTHNDDQYQTGG